MSQAGYTGSLTQNFVGYAFDLVAVEEASLKVTRDATTTTTSQYEVGQTADAGVLTAAMLAAASDEQVSRVDSAAPAEAAIVGATSHGMVSRDRPPEAPSTHHSNTPPADVEHVSLLRGGCRLSIKRTWSMPKRYTRRSTAVLRVNIDRVIVLWSFYRI